MTSVRPATVADAGRVGAILSEFVDTTAWMPRIHSRAEDLAHAEAMVTRGWVLVAVQDGTLAGFAAFDQGALNALYVAKDWRGQGIGGALVRHLQARHDRIALWTFQANTGAQRFYAAHGFAPVRRTNGAGNDEKLPDVQFSWQREAA